MDGPTESIGGDVSMSITLHVTPTQQYNPGAHPSCFPDRQCVSIEHPSTASAYVAPQKKEFDVSLYAMGAIVGDTVGGKSRRLHPVSAKHV
jgi:hypothetical protein